MVKKLPANAGDMDSVPESGKSPGEGNGNLFQYSCLRNPMDRGTGGLQSIGSQKNWTQLSNEAIIITTLTGVKV